ncbi:hypothetical protein EKK58_07330 [Candidatus Dependentiae bacterium]|nr:MAG: hypothetical protein EKK58_07330 [Candidatus Dependentiae bacterium]
MMSYSNDYAEEQKELLEDETWKGSDGKLIPISDMSDRYLENVINIVEGRKSNYFNEKWLELFYAEKKSREKEVKDMFK